MADDDAGVSLHPDTLAALAAFMAEKRAQEERAKGEAEDSSASLIMAEDWQQSQFWYAEDTAQFLAGEVRWCAAQAPGAIAFISSPSAYKAFRSSSAAAAAAAAAPGAFLLEYDARFAVFGDAFVQYDYNQPLALPAHLLGRCSVIMLDPPFLNEDCLAGFAETVRALSVPGGARVLLATGAVQLAAAAKLLGLRPTRRPILHAKRLSNPFALFANYEHEEALLGWDEAAEAAARQG